MFFLSLTISSPMSFFLTPRLIFSCLLASNSSFSLFQSSSMCLLSLDSSAVSIAVIETSLLWYILEQNFTPKTCECSSQNFLRERSSLFLAARRSSFRNLFSTLSSILIFSSSALASFSLSSKLSRVATSYLSYYFSMPSSAIRSSSCLTQFWWAILSIYFSVSSFLRAVFCRWTSC